MEYDKAGSIFDINSDRIRAKSTLFTMQHLASIDISEGINDQHTNIICTLGPSSQSVEIIAQLIINGMNIARLNFSHGSYDYHLKSIQNIRQAEQSLYNGRLIGIALDTKGPEIRTGVIDEHIGDHIDLKEGDTVIITTDNKYANKCNKQHLYVTYERMTNLIRKDQMIFIDDGMLCIRANEKSTEPNEIKCTVVNGDKDRMDIAFGVKHGVDFIFASFIRSAQAVREIREILGDPGKHIKIIAKLENQQGIRNLEEIINEADGIMVARGDLGIEIPPEKVFVAQKKIITSCNIIGKPVICATQMLESMTYNPRATRAEVSDVANAIIDGADCVMLSGETAKGKYPIQCVELMAKIARQAENCIFHKERFLTLTHTDCSLPQDTVTAIAAVEASFKVNATIIIVLTSTGRSAALVSRYCPKATIMAVTRLKSTARGLSIFRGVYPVFVEDELVNDAKIHACSSSDDLKISQQTRILQSSMNMNDWLLDIEKRVQLATDVAKKQGYIKSGDSMICVTGWRSGSGSTNTVRVMYCA
ncbi:hypothetical protein GJ496_011981 [Pomphorhynchus laevis]|nr:hypothetical protein GJ496_011981 [Pomphorhynchus laevis]